MVVEGTLRVRIRDLVYGAQTDVASLASLVKTRAKHALMSASKSMEKKGLIMDRSTASTGSTEAVLNQMVHGFGTLLVVYDKDRYGRQVAEVMQGESNQNLAMVRSGHAAVYRKYCPESYSDYYLAEEAAQRSKSGIWEKPGLHQSPWEWRHREK